jgi:hypothetical protein
LADFFKSRGRSIEQLTEWLSERDVIACWEARRFRFNVYVGMVGAASWILVLLAGSAAVKPGVDFEEPLAMLFGPFVYGVLANVCYTFAWMVDTIFYFGSPRTRLYKAGMIFSVVLTALPGIWAVVAWLMTAITGNKLD